ncbi:MAG: hypothetical protein V1709_10610 [Planctomycetota bacterium]
MRMTLKRTIIYISLLSILCLLSSCIYLRLLKFKNQMADFDRCFQVKEDKGLTLICLKPVLYSDDIGTMLDPPTLSKKTKQSEQWTYVFEKNYPNNIKSDKDDFDIALDLTFKGDLLNEIHLPERFLVILPKPFLIMVCKAMGNAEVNTKERSAKGTYEQKEKETSQIKIPKQDEVLKFLGNPFVWQEDETNVQLLYEYWLKKKTAKHDNSTPCIWIEFTFQKKDGTLLKAKANLCGMKLSLNFVPDNKKDGKKPDNK